MRSRLLCCELIAALPYQTQMATVGLVLLGVSLGGAVLFVAALLALKAVVRRERRRGVSIPFVVDGEDNGPAATRFH